MTAARGGRIKEQSDRHHQTRGHKTTHRDNTARRPAPSTAAAISVAIYVGASWIYHLAAQAWGAP